MRGVLVARWGQSSFRRVDGPCGERSPQWRGWKTPPSGLRRPSHLAVMAVMPWIEVRA